MSKRAPQGAPPSSDTALLLIDVITDFQFEDGQKLWHNAHPIVQPIAVLKARARTAGIPVINVNDNFGNWQEDLKRQVERIMADSKEGREFICKIKPDPDDYYILKPQRSGFYETPLAVLLGSMEVKNLIIAGITTDICVLFTAHDAYMRGFKVRVPADCTAAVENEHKDEALKLMSRVADVDTSPSAEIRMKSRGEKQKN